jgi:hypothetical protein
MRNIALLVAIVAAIVLAPRIGAALLMRTFDDDPIGVAPPGFAFASVRQATLGRWMVRADGADRHLTHLADSHAHEGQSFALAEAASPSRLRASVRIKFRDGEQVAGLVWRYQNPEHFFIASLDLHKQEIALYQVVRGTRVKLEEDDDLELDRDAWHMLTVRDDGTRVRISLDGVGVVRSRASAVGDPGRSGVWSGGGSTTWFDDLRIEDDPRRDE